MSGPEREHPRRPFVQVNCAVSVDGRLAYAGGARARLSGPEDLERVQRLRADSDAILVGVGTVLLDDPSLRVHWELLGEARPHSPLRVIVDSMGRTPPNARVLDGTTPTLFATVEPCERTFPAGVEVFRRGRTEVDLAGLLEHLSGRGIRRLLVEGGSRILTSFFRGRLVDRFTVYIAPVLIGGATAPSLIGGAEAPGPESTVGLRQVSVAPLGAGLLATYEPAPLAPTSNPPHSSPTLGQN